MADTLEPTVPPPATPRGPASAPGHHRLDIQGLRGIAVLLVVAFHAGLPLPGGFVGVDVFFVISGFVITSSLLREVRSGGRFSLRQFYARRIRRLLPAATVLLAVVGVLCALLSSPVAGQSEGLATGLAAVVWLANVQRYVEGQGYFDASEEVNPFLHMWSLSVEEQFYLVLPALLLVALAVARRAGADPVRALTVAAASTAAVSLALSLFAVDGSGGPIPEPQRFAFYLLPTRWWEMAAGVLLALVLHRRDRLGGAGRWIPTLVGASAVGVLLVVSVAYTATTPFPGLAAIPPVAAAMALIACAPRSAGISRLLSSKPLVATGDISYSWYLWHWPLIVFAGLLVPDSPAVLVAAAVASLAPAIASHRWIESRYLLRHAQGRPTRPALQLAAGCIGATALLLGVLLATVPVRTDPPPELEARTEAREAGCHVEGYAGEPWPADRCLFESPGDGGTVLLVGDSFAVSAADAVQDAAGASGADLAVWTHSRCPAVARDMRDFPECDRFHDAVLDLVDTLRPRVVVASNRSPAYTCGLGEGCDGSVAPLGGDGREAVLAGWRAGIDELADLLEARGTRLVLLGTGPEFPYDPAATVSAVRPDGVSPTIPRSEAEDQLGETQAIEREVTAAHQSAFVDPLAVGCTDVCPSRDEGTWLVYDRSHPTIPSTMRLVPQLTEALEG